MTSVDLNVYASIPTRNMIEYGVKYDSWSSSAKKKARTTAQDHTPTEHKKTWPGTRIGHLTVVDATDQRKSEYIVWRCRCDCGNEILLDTRALRRQTITDCGCITKVKPGQKDMTGQRFGKLVCLYPEQGKSKNGSSVWRCRCDCGNICTVGQTKLQSGLTVSCGCYNAEKRRESQKNVDGTRISLLESLLSGKLRETNTSGHTGVSFHKNTGKWRASITFQGKDHYLGEYTAKEDAIMVREQAEDMFRDFLLGHGEKVPERDA